MGKFGKSKFMLLVIALAMALAFNNTMQKDALGDTTKVDPGVTFSGQADVPNPPVGIAGVVSLPIVITADDSGDLKASSFISVITPTGLKFTNETSSLITFDGSSFTATVGGSNQSIGTAGTVTAAFLSSDKTEIRIIVGAVGTGTLNIGTATVATALQLCPTDDSIKAPSDKKNGTFLITVNGGTNNVQNVTAGTLNELVRPDIKMVEEFSSTEVKVTLNGPATDAVATTASIFTFGTTTVANAADVVVPADNATLDSSDKSVVTLKIPSGFTLNFDEKPSVRITSAAGVTHRDDNSSVSPTVGNSSTKPILISKSGTVDPVITLSQTMVGVNGAASDKTSNKLTVNIKSTAGQPLALKITDKADTNDNSPMDLNDTSLKVSGNNSEIVGEDGVDPAASTGSTKNNSDDLNADVRVICGKDNDGDIDVVILFGDNPGTTSVFGNNAFVNTGDTDAILPLNSAAKAVAIGDEKTLKVLVSPDGFTNKITKAEFTVDVKGPELITSGTDKPATGSGAANRNTIMLTFNEDLDKTAAENKKHFCIKDAGAGATAVAAADTDLTIESVVLDPANAKKITITTKELFTSLGKIGVYVVNGSPTASLGDIKNNPISKFLSGGDTDTNCGGVTDTTITFAELVNLDAPDANAPRKDSVSLSATTDGASGVSDAASNVTYTLVGSNGATLSRFVSQVFVTGTGNDLGIDFNQPVTTSHDGAETATSSTEINKAPVESPAGTYKGEYELPDANLDTGESVRLVCAVLNKDTDSHPSSLQGWLDLNAFSSNAIGVSNTKPVVLGAAQAKDVDGNLIADEVDVLFSKVMNIETIRDILPRLTTSAGDLISIATTFTVLDGGSTIGYMTLTDLPDGETITIDFDPQTSSTTMVADTFGNQMDNDETLGVDQATLTAVLPTPVPTTTVPGITPTPTPTPPVVIETPTPTPPVVIETPTPTPPVVIETPTPTPPVVIETPTPTPVVTATPATPTPTPEPTEVPAVLTELSATPATLGRKFKPQTVVIIAKDQFGKVMAGQTINASVNGKATSVEPSSVVTGALGNAEFQVKFGFRTRGGSATFTSGGVTATVTQQ